MQPGDEEESEQQLGLTGNIPPILGSLFELTHLDLSDNSLTGQFPWDIGSLANLEVLKLGERL